MPRAEAPRVRWGGLSQRGKSILKRLEHLEELHEDEFAINYSVLVGVGRHIVAEVCCKEGA